MLKTKETRYLLSLSSTDVKILDSVSNNRWRAPIYNPLMEGQGTHGYVLKNGLRVQHRQSIDTVRVSMPCFSCRLIRISTCANYTIQHANTFYCFPGKMGLNQLKIYFYFKFIYKSLSLRFKFLLKLTFFIKKCW